MNTIHLFAGSGGGLYSDLILGHTPILAIEIERYCCDVLEQRKAEGWFPGLLVHCGDVREFDFKPWAGKVAQISAGFPCQNISCAGDGTGISGPKSGLVSEVWRAIDVIRPGLVFLENSPNIRTKGRREIITELVARGYSWRDGTLAASDVGAPHKRNRWWLLAANTDGMRQLESERREREQRGWACNQAEAFTDFDSQRGEWIKGRSSTRNDCHRNNPDWSKNAGGAYQCVENVADPMRDGLEGAIQRSGIPETDYPEIEAVKRYTGAYNWNPVNPRIVGMADGLPNRKHRIKALGNAQVPLQAALAFTILSGMEG